MLEHNISIKHSAVKLIVSDSDHLSNVMADKLHSVFQCPVINRYDNEENGLLAYTTKNAEAFIANRAIYVMELLKLGVDEPAERANWDAS